MPSYNYDYAPLTNGHKPHARKPWFWPACVAALLIIDVAVVFFFISHRQVPPSPLDYFQKLNNVSVVNMKAAPSVSPSASTDHAIVSSLYTDSYAPAVIALGHSLKAANTSARMILIYLPDHVSPRTRCLATAAGWTLHPVTFIPPPHNGDGLPPHFNDQYTKLNIWALDSIGLNSLVYLDADTLVRSNFDELFDLPYNFAAVPDVFEDRRGFTIGFNAGVMFLRPSTAVFTDMLAKLDTAEYPPAFAEQAFLNVYFGAQVVRLPYTYNANLAIKMRSPALWKALADDMRIVHYTVDKPFPAKGVELDLERAGPQELEAFFEKRGRVRNGLWLEEMGWWEKAWKETAAATVMQDALAQCA